MNVQPKSPPRAPKKNEPPTWRETLARYRAMLPPWRVAALWALWAYYVWWTGSGAFRALLSVPRLYPQGLTTITPPPPWSWSISVAASPRSFSAYIFNPFAWLNGKRLVIGCTALAVMLGRLTAEMWHEIFKWFLLSLPAPDSPLGMLLTPLLMAIGGVTVIAILGTILFFGFAFIVGAPVVLFNQILMFENSLHIYRYQANGLASYIVRFVFWLRSEAMPKTLDDSKGARFAAPEEIARLRDDARHGLRPCRRPLLQLHTEKHVLIMASTRSGKGVTLIIPHLLRYRGSAFVLDPKGENAKATGRQRAALNEKVYYLDPFGISGKPPARFNPLSRFTPRKYGSRKQGAGRRFVRHQG